jgi:hypothetical protein
MAWDATTGRFPTSASGLSMSQLLTGFNLQPGAIPLTYPFSLTTLVGKKYWQVSGSGSAATITEITIALPIEMSEFFDVFFLDPNPSSDIPVTASPVPLPTNLSPTGFSMTLIGGGGGGGGGGGAFIVTNGGDGGGGGAGGTLVTNFIPYTGPITVTLPTAGAQGTGGSGSSGGPSGNNGADGGVGGNAELVYNSTTFTAFGGGHGQAGGGGNGAGNGGDGNAGSGGSFTGPLYSTGTNGDKASGFNGGLNPTVGRGGNGGQKGFSDGGNGGMGGVGAQPGSITIKWYFT